ncbi:hypothetical protein EV175_006189 [Coemansia sp. RSA 1933]|nr:hypothetical protein EV175_006189 [Coemansia sp. RSA 1933]
MVNYLGLCQSWRHHCIPLYCQDMSVTMNRTFSALEDTHHWLATIADVLRLSGQRYTRNVHLHVPLSQVLNGMLPRLLAEKPYRDAVFPNVSVVWLEMYMGGNLGDMIDDCTEAIDMLVMEIRRMFPNAGTCSIGSSVALAPSEKWALQHCDELFGKLMANTSALRYFTTSDHFATTLLPPLLGLTRITYFECQSAGQFMQLICNNRHTLVIINLELKKPDTFLQLFPADYDSAQSLVFPQLEKLEVVCMENSVFPVPRIRAHEELFPNLKKLRFHHPYPFSNDALFRGNYSKLEHLSLGLDTNDAWNLVQNGILASNKFTALKYVDIDVNLSHQPMDLEYGRQISKLLWNMAPIQEHLSANLLGFAYKEAFLQEAACAAKSIVFLSVGSLDLDLWETIRILQHLPQLSQLELNPKTMDIAKPWYLQNIISVEYLNDLVGQFQPLAPCLRHVLFDLGLYSDMEGAAHFAAQLAILCPKVSCIRWGMHSTAFETQCKALAETLVYAKHAARLELVDWTKIS